MTQAEQKRVAAEVAAAECHPLFPLKIGEKYPARIEWIQLTRNEPPSPTNPYGLPVTIPQVIPAGELQSLQDIAERHGGGSYMLMGRASNNEGMPGREVKSTRVTVPGSPMPFLKADGSPSQPAPGVSTGHADPTMLLIQVMQQSSQQAAQQAAAAAAVQQASADRQMQMMMAMMEQSRQSAQQQSMMQIESMKAFAAMMTGQRQDPGSMFASAVQAVTSIIPKPTDPKDPMALLEQAMNISEKIKGGTKDATESLAELGQGFG
ncbi:MAG: hypothetical protein ACHQ50_17065, partial [Fimbriimonadales bacterium]